MEISVVGAQIGQLHHLHVQPFRQELYCGGRVNCLGGRVSECVNVRADLSHLVADLRRGRRA